MLLELYIRNFAIIDELRLQFNPGFNVLTGETGAGKSIILDAVELAMGDRADTTMIRTGAEEAYVEATFELNSNALSAVTPLLAAEGLEDDPNNIVVLAREMRASGRSIARVNGRSVSLALLRQICEPFVDIHGQGDHLSLLKPKSHLPLLDSYAGLTSSQEEIAQQVSQLRKVQRELAELRKNERAIAQRVDMLRFQVNEIEAAALNKGEEEALREERTRLANAEHLTQHAGEVTALLVGEDDDDPGSILDKLGQAERTLAQLTRFDSTQATQLEQLQGLAFQLNELAADLQKYRDELEYNPDRLNYVEERVELINSLKRKYGSDIEAILLWQQKAEEELEQISHSEERIGELVAKEAQFLRHIGALAEKLSQLRKAAGQRLATVIERHLADLNMDGARFQVEFRIESADDGAIVEVDGLEQRFSFDETGIDQVQFLISANPGEPLKPMAKVASGGETSRLMLALKTALTEVDRTPTLIFDEIDQGIGGRVGDVVGQKLWALTATDRHQVIVVTHLPQLAGYGDFHFRVSKQVHEGRTTTAVVNLDPGGRINELAAMLGTRGEHAIGGAEAILQRARAAKMAASPVS